MKSGKFIFIVGIVILLVSGVIAEGTYKYICYKNSISCDEVRSLILEKKDSISKEMDINFKGIDKSKEILDLAIKDLEKNNIDTTELKNKLSIMDFKVLKYREDYKIFLDKVSIMSNNNCNKEDLVTTSKEVDKQYELLLQDSKEIKDYAPQVGLELEKINKEIDAKKG